MNTLNLKPGNTIYLTCDGERIYISPQKQNIPKLMAIFERETGTIITRGYHKPLTDTKFEPITQPPYKKITNQDKVLVEED